MPNTTEINARIRQTVAGSSPSATTFVLFPAPANDGDAVTVELMLHVRDDGDPTDFYAQDLKLIVDRSSGLNFNQVYASTAVGSLAITPSLSSSGSDLVVTCTYSGTLRWEIDATLKQWA